VKKIILIILTFFVMIINVNANESYDYTYIGVEKRGSAIGGIKPGIFNLSDLNGNVLNAYCMDYDYLIVDDYSYSLVNVEDANYVEDKIAHTIRNIVSNAYPFKTIEEIETISGITDLTEEDAIASVQAAIWYYANGINFILKDNVKLLYEFYLELEESNIPATDISDLEIDVHSYFENDIINTLIKINKENIYDLNFLFNRDLIAEYGVIVEEVPEGLLIKGLPEGTEFNITLNAKQNIVENVYFFHPNGGRTMSQSLVGVNSGTINVSNSETIKIENITVLEEEKKENTNKKENSIETKENFYIENPQTEDNVSAYFILAFLSIIGMILTIYVTRKMAKD